MAHIKKLTKLGGSSALVIDRSYLARLDIRERGKVRLDMDGRTITIQAAPARAQLTSRRGRKSTKARS